MAVEIDIRRRALRRAYAEQMPPRVTRIVCAWQGVRASANGAALGGLEAEVRSLAGSSAALGFDAVAEAARNLQLYLDVAPGRGGDTAPLWGDEAAPGHGDGFRVRVDGLVEALERAGREAASGPGEDLQGLSPGERPPGPSRVERVLYMLSADGALARDLGLELGYFGYAVRRFEAVEPLLEGLDQTTPTAVLLDATDFERGLADARRIDARRAETGCGLLLFFLAPRGDLEARLAAVRAGGDAFLPMPVESRRLVERLDLASPKTRADPYRVLIVEESYPQALDLALTLQRGGIATQLVEEPGRVWAALVEFAPDLLLIGAAGDGAAALELAAVVRQQDAYAELPLLLLAGDPRPAVRVEALRLAADEVLARPVAEVHLLSTVTGHAHRARVRQRFASTDGLTGLLTHSAFIARLGRAVERAHQTGGRLTYAVLDVDHLHSINQTFGHLSGNSVLRALGRLLARRLRHADLVSRWGGDEFVVALPDTPGEAGLSVLDQVRAMFAGIAHRSSEGEFRASFSGGLTTLSRAGAAADLHQAARAALRTARAAGRDRLELSAG
jgi:diguanylate cyclase (GGDEF)-like protein